jgi:DNA-binding MarR family transcriptional regulator
MIKKEAIYKYVEQPRAIKTLLVLNENPSKPLDNILDLIGGSKSTGMKRIKELAELGLLTKEASMKEPKRIFYKLNEKGIEISKSLIKLGEKYND